MEKDSGFITVVGASENNLKNISLDIPIGRITCVSGVSGSGKSTLVNAVIAGEAFRREKLSGGNPYYRLVRPDFKSIKNLPKVLLINQRPLQHLGSSTVATASGFSDLLRDSFLKDGIIECDCGDVVENKISFDTINKAINIYAGCDGVRILVEYVDGQPFSGKRFSRYMREHGFFSFLIDGKKKVYSLDNIGVLKEGGKYRLHCEASSLDDLALNKVPTDRISVYYGDELLLDFSYQTFCASCMKEYQKKSLSLFTTSRLSEKSGCCTCCLGEGKIQEINENLLLNYKGSLDDGFLNIHCDGERYKSLGIYKSSLSKIIKNCGFKSSTPYSELSCEARDKICSLVKERLVKNSDDKSLEGFLIETECGSCCGSGFNYKARAVKIDGRNISEVLSLTIDEAVFALKNSRFDPVLNALSDLSLGHLSLGRSTDTLSGGELQRIKLVKAVSSGITNSLIIIDEPSSGLSVGDIDNLFRLLARLRDEGNTVLIVDHSEYIIKKSDCNLTLGMGSGAVGGNIIERADEGFDRSDVQEGGAKLGKWEGKFLALFPVSYNNILDQRVVIPLGAITAVVGNSGSGKSSLVGGVLDGIKRGSLIESSNVELVSDVVLLNQRQVRANKRSTVLTFLGLADSLRNIFAATNVAKALCLDSSYFTHNGNNGACPHCKGDGEIDGLTCFSCGGARFKGVVLSVVINDLNIHEVLGKSVVDIMALELSPLISKGCKILCELGLGHLSLGRVLTDVSGGEAQRLNLARFLLEHEKSIVDPAKHLLIVLDEPCRGLSTRDSKLVLDILRRMTISNNTFVVIEHNPFVISQSDYVIKLGPGVGSQGGRIVFSDFSGRYEAGGFTVGEGSPKSIIGLSSCDVDLSDDDKRFSLIKRFADNYEVAGGDQVVNFRSKEELILFARKNSGDGFFYFNPFCNDLFVSGIVPRSTVKARFSELLKFGLESVYVAGNLIGLKTAYKHVGNENIWDVYVPSPDPDLAYSLGGGWLALRCGNEFCNVSTRLVDVERKVVGSRSVTANTFNIFYNGCDTCLGRGDLFFYDGFIGDEDKSIVDLDFYKKEIQGYVKKHIAFRIKEAVATFKSEGLLDLSRPFSSLDHNEKMLAFFGVPNLSFVKKNGRVDALSDRVEWVGLIPIFNMHAERIKKDSGLDVGAGKRLIKCPECGGKKFKKEVSYYRIDGKAICD